MAIKFMNKITFAFLASAGLKFHGGSTRKLVRFSLKRVILSEVISANVNLKRKYICMKKIGRQRGRSPITGAQFQVMAMVNLSGKKKRRKFKLFFNMHGKPVSKIYEQLS